MSVTIREHFCSTTENPVWQVIVERKGREYRTLYAGERPTEEKIAADFEGDRQQRRLDKWR